MSLAGLLALAVLCVCLLLFSPASSWLLLSVYCSLLFAVRYAVQFPAIYDSWIRGGQERLAKWLGFDLLGDNLWIGESLHSIHLLLSSC